MQKHEILLGFSRFMHVVALYNDGMGSSQKETKIIPKVSEDFGCKVGIVLQITVRLSNFNVSYRSLKISIV